MSTSRKRTRPGSAAPTETYIGEDEESPHRRGNGTARGNDRSATGAFLRRLRRTAAAGGGESQGGIAGLLLDAAVGLVLGVLGMSVLLLMDYWSVINLETSRVLRRTASELLRSPGANVIEILEEEMERRLVPIEEYQSMRRELSNARHAMDIEGKIVEARIWKAASLRVELESLRGEKDRLMAETGLDAFCPACKWGMGMNCQQRLNYMLENYSDTATTINCMAKLVDEGNKKNGKCLKPNIPKRQPDGSWQMAAAAKPS